MRLAISSLVGSRPSSCSNCLLVRTVIDRFDHVHRDKDGARLVGDGSPDGLTNPPRRVGGKLVSTAPLRNLSTTFINPMFPS